MGSFSYKQKNQIVVIFFFVQHDLNFLRNKIVLHLVLRVMVYALYLKLFVCSDKPFLFVWYWCCHMCFTCLVLSQRDFHPLPPCLGAQSQGVWWFSRWCLVLWGYPLCSDGRISSLQWDWSSNIIQKGTCTLLGQIIYPHPANFTYRSVV